MFTSMNCKWDTSDLVLHYDISSFSLPSPLNSFSCPCAIFSFFSVRSRLITTKNIDTSFWYSTLWNNTSPVVICLALQVSDQDYLRGAFSRPLLDTYLKTVSFVPSSLKLAAHSALSNCTYAGSTSTVLWDANDHLWITAPTSKNESSGTIRFQPPMLIPLTEIRSQCSFHFWRRHLMS